MIARFTQWPAWLWMLLAASITMGLLLTQPPLAFAEDDQEEQRYEDDEDQESEDWEWDEEEEMEWFFVEVEMYQKLLEIVSQSHRIAADPSVAAVAGVLKVEEHADEPSDTAAFLEGLLPQVHDATVIRAIRFQLVDTYAEMDQPEKSLEQLRLLITAHDR